MLSAEQTAIATFIGIIIGSAASVVIGRLLMDPRIRALEEKLNLLLEMMINQQKPPTT